MLRIDLHTHSAASPDGGITARQYARQCKLEVIAVTDHDQIDEAQRLQKQLGANKIIVGQEVTTTDGDIIGLYLNKVVPAGLSAFLAAQAIHEQGGLVYIPHPFETVRHGISLKDLNAIADYVDIVEAYNGRAIFQNRSHQAQDWAKQHKMPLAASSDAHGFIGWGRTYSIISDYPSKETLPTLLKNASYATSSVHLGVLYPKLQRLRKRVRRAS